MSVSEKLISVAQNVSKVYMAGENVGNREGYILGYGAGYEAGKNEGGGADLPVLDVPAEPSDIRLGKEVINADGEKVTGTMPEHLDVNTELTINKPYFEVQEGYHKGCSISVAGENPISVTPKAHEAVSVCSEEGKFLIEVNVEPATEAYAEGQQAEHDRFWDTYQINGTRSNYNYAFRGKSWSDVNFYPKYNINLVGAGAQYMFQGAFITDLKQRLVDCSVTLDMSESTQLYQLAPSSKITKFPELGGDKITNINNAFQSCTELKSIDKLHLSTSSSCACASAFTNVPNLVEIRFNEGIRPTGLNFKSCTLMSRESLASMNEDGKGYGLIPALSDDVTGSVTVSASAVSAAFQDRSEWDALCNTKPTWTIMEV